MERGLNIKSAKIANAGEGEGEEEGEEFQVELDFPWREVKTGTCPERLGISKFGQKCPLMFAAFTIQILQDKHAGRPQYLPPSFQ